MLPRQEDAAADGLFSFGSPVGDGDLARLQRPLGSHDYASSRSLDLRKGSGRSYNGLGGHHRLFDYPLPVSSSQKMVAYRQEMMARVESMPEGTYELSLRDIVEVPKAKGGSPRTGSRALEQEDKQQKPKGWKRWREQVVGNARQQPGVFLLRVFLPLHRRSGKQRSAVVGSKVSPKPNSSGSDDASRSSSGKTRMSGCYSFLLKDSS